MYFGGRSRVAIVQSFNALDCVLILSFVSTFMEKMRVLIALI